jgi:hypothetical protein
VLYARRARRNIDVYVYIHTFYIDMCICTLRPTPYLKLRLFIGSRANDSRSLLPDNRSLYTWCGADAVPSRRLCPKRFRPQIWDLDLNLKFGA